MTVSNAAICVCKLVAHVAENSDVVLVPTHQVWKWLCKAKDKPPTGWQQQHQHLWYNNWSTTTQNIHIVIRNALHNSRHYSLVAKFRGNEQKSSFQHTHCRRHRHRVKVLQTNLGYLPRIIKFTHQKSHNRYSFVLIIWTTQSLNLDRGKEQSLSDPTTKQGYINSSKWRNFF